MKEKDIEYFYPSIFSTSHITSSWDPSYAQHLWFKTSRLKSHHDGKDLIHTISDQGSGADGGEGEQEMLT